MAAKKADPVADMLAVQLEKVRKRFGVQSAVIPSVDDGQSEVKEVIPSGIDVVDRYVCGIGGLAAGRVTELFSAEGGGKTTFAWTLLGAHTTTGGFAMYCDNEQSYDSERALKFGVRQDRILLLQPYTLEEAIEMQLEVLNNLKPGKVPHLGVWDSIAGSQYDNELNKGFDKAVQDDRAAKLGRFARQATYLAVQKQVHLLLVNQERLLRGVMFGPNTTTPGGKAVKYAASLRLQLFSGKSLKDAVGQHIGKTITFMAVKSRFSAPFRKAKVRLYYDHGWDNCWATINHAKDLQLIDKGLKATEPATYEKAVAALGWKNAGPWKLLPPQGEVKDEADDAEWAGETDE